jgi:hypothetical protein
MVSERAIVRGAHLPVEAPPFGRGASLNSVKYRFYSVINYYKLINLISQSKLDIFIYKQNHLVYLTIYVNQ